MSNYDAFPHLSQSLFKKCSDLFANGLLDMLRFYAAAFLSVTHNLETTRNLLLSFQFMEPHVPLDWDKIEKHLDDIAQEINTLPLSRSLKAQVGRAQKVAKDHNDLQVPHLITVMGEISHNIVNELSEHLFFLVPSELKWLYLKPENFLGSECESKFPSAIKDAHDGIRCFVLDQWTASVFHFMRVLEHGVHWLANEVGLVTANISLENWKNILDQIEKTIRELEKLPKSQTKSDDLKFYSEAAVNFRYFKDAWRNHVSHARVNYDSKDAKRIMDHVGDFMRHLAFRVP